MQNLGGGGNGGGGMGGGGRGTNKEYIMGFLILVKTFSLPAEPFLTRRERKDSAEIVLNFY